MGAKQRTKDENRKICPGDLVKAMDGENLRYGVGPNHSGIGIVLEEHVREGFEIVPPPFWVMFEGATQACLISSDELEVVQSVGSE